MQAERAEEGVKLRTASVWSPHTPHPALLAWCMHWYVLSGKQYTIHTCVQGTLLCEQNKGLRMGNGCPNPGSGCERMLAAHCPLMRLVWRVVGHTMLRITPHTADRPGSRSLTHATTRTCKLSLLTSCGPRWGIECMCPRLAATQRPRLLQQRCSSRWTDLPQ